MTRRCPQRTKTPYTKTALTFEEQLQQLKDRGMDVEDDTKALHYLSQLNYYRLGAYWLPFENNHKNHSFRQGTSFEAVLNLYVFDRELRLLIMDAIERVEVSLRTQLAYHLGHVHGPHAHLQEALFADKDLYCGSIGKLESEVKRSTEDFIKHLVCKYEERLPPIWAVVELMTMGQLSKLYGNLAARKDRKAIAEPYDLDEKHLGSFLHHLSTVRNHCAHHARVWNREFTITSRIPTRRPHELISSFRHDDKVATRKLYNTLVMLAYLLELISPRSQWKARLIQLIKTHRIDPHAMGFPGDWQERTIWSP